MKTTNKIRNELQIRKETWRDGEKQQKIKTKGKRRNKNVFVNSKVLRKQQQKQEKDHKWLRKFDKKNKTAKER